ncbi:U3 small nucleolar RNA-associated protein 6 [Ostreococcus tauri]|uniref:U3 small nucleolar RNA-associated protein 6 n=1 Tax=Ostreococcus tauri TaxID=70448 RepID=A0A090M7D4_OSTTA|nr:U3 small nucleolar RNA-associated protein 6 [Ostreococcus tauri]CEG00948.1 U3 small nucleolar RNA-associated protein 6 [Ostreococcus tauri]|eukprot:XP_022840692.1 U3 small nucleolar RNA-associated protein 6 [Ostreococcus tauri]
MNTIEEALDSSVDQLSQLELAYSVNSTQTRQILAKRSQYEHFLARRTSSTESAFFAYASYELALASTLTSRNKRQDRNKVNSVIFRHVRGILARAVREHVWSLRLWHIFVRFCEEHGSSRLLSRALARALRYHSTCVGLWLRAAAFEFQTNQNMNAARSLFHRALRSCDQNQDIWIAYFRLEIMYANMLKTRQDVLISGSPRERGNKSTNEVKFDVVHGALALCVFQKAIESQKGQKDRAFTMMRMFAVATDLHSPSRLLKHMRLSDESSTSVAAVFLNDASSHNIQSFSSLHMFLKLRDHHKTIFRQIRNSSLNTTKFNYLAEAWTDPSFLINGVSRRDNVAILVARQGTLDSYLCYVYNRQLKLAMEVNVLSREQDYLHKGGTFRALNCLSDDSFQS